MRFLNEVQFAREKVIEVNQFRVAFDDDVRALLEGQPDVETETMFAACAPLTEVVPSTPLAAAVALCGLPS